MIGYPSEQDGPILPTQDYPLCSSKSEILLVIYYSTIAPFYHIRAQERAKYATLLHCRTGQKYGLKRSEERQNGRTKRTKEWWNNKSLIRYERTFCSLLVFFLAPMGLRKILRNSQNIRAYYMLNHRIRCI